MNIIPKPYRRFFWLFTILTPFITTVVLASFTFLLYVADIGMISWFALYFIGLSLPVSATVALIASKKRLVRSEQDLIYISSVGFCVSLVYIFIVMIITDLTTHQVGSYFHREVLIIAVFATISISVNANFLLPKDEQLIKEK